MHSISRLDVPRIGQIQEKFTKPRTQKARSLLNINHKIYNANGKTKLMILCIRNWKFNRVQCLFKDSSQSHCDSQKSRFRSFCRPIRYHLQALRQVLMETAQSNLIWFFRLKMHFSTREPESGQCVPFFQESTHHRDVPVSCQMWRNPHFVMATFSWQTIITKCCELLVLPTGIGIGSLVRFLSVVLGVVLGCKSHNCAVSQGIHYCLHSSAWHQSINHMLSNANPEKKCTKK